MIGRLQILEQLFKTVIVPPAVDAEVRALQDRGNDISSYLNSDSITMVTPQNRGKVEALSSHLDIGESEAIAGALELKCNLLLLDERLGTRIARAEGLRTVGLVGVLTQAKDRGVIDRVAPVFADLRGRAGFWLGRDVEQYVLREVGE